MPPDTIARLKMVRSIFAHGFKPKALLWALAPGIAIGALLHLVDLALWRMGLPPSDNLIDEVLVATAVTIAFLFRTKSQSEQSALTQKLQEAERRTRVAMSTGKIAVWEWDLLTGEQYWSENCAELLGHPSSGTAAGFETFLNAVYPDDRARLQQDVESAIQEKRDHHCEFRVIWADGSVHWQQAQARAFYDEHNRPVRMIGIATDIDDRKRSEEQLHLQAEILNVVANAVLITDPNGNIVWANPAFTKLTGYSLDEVRLQNVRFLRSGRQATAFYADLWQTIKAGRVWRGEIVNRRKSGSLYCEEMTITPIKNDAGVITNFVAIKQDVTSRKHLAERVQMLANVVENSSNLIGISETGSNGGIVYANKALLKTLQHSMEDLIGKQFGDLLSKANPPQLLQEIGQRSLQPGGWQGECLVPRKDGTDIPVLLSSSVITGEKGQAFGVVGIAQDITERKLAEKDLVFKNALLRAEAETTLDGILAVDDANRVILSNRRFAEIWGIPQTMLDAGEDAPLMRFVADQIEDVPGFIRRVEYLYDHPAEKAKDEIRLKDGRVLERYSSPFLNPQGTYLGRIWYFRDITERLQNAERVKLWSEVLNQSAEGIFICNAAERVVVVNGAFEQLTGFTASEVLGRSPGILKSDHHAASFYLEIRAELLAAGVWRGEMWIPRKAGEPFAALLSISVVQDQSGLPTHYVGIFSDVTAHKLDQERMLRLAQYDALTDLPNRKLLLEHLNHMTKNAERRGTKVAVIFIDLDRFKEVNDSLGHDSGDVLLQTVAKRLSGTVRAGQDTVGRMGGDEFVVLLPGLESTGDLATVAQKLLSCFLVPINIKGHSLTATASIGIAVYPDDGSAEQDLIRSADAAMYQAKAAGRNNFKFYTSDLQQRAMEMLSMENGLRRAIELGEFFLEYQPQVSLGTGRLAGVEALIRWKRPGEGVVMPGRFIAIAEERGLIVPIGNWVIDEVCRQAATWQESGILSVPIAINVSAVQFRQRDFEEHLLETARRYGIAPSTLDRTHRGYGDT